ncbi:piggyBac transposable element-derived protein 4 [Trichonephila inaurata madagascariensis]|uniref:PiggyBac transposable element-derived protein 4 n=1 Tax=Trichonephila inaurata madagascariensis TaxID=2747483 RepID=A0A8X7CIA6_9ARAC|nr:piggyBac transposable element-derived protein 4 [Trichonephila inaurata madagascariensis]
MKLKSVVSLRNPTPVSVSCEEKESSSNSKTFSKTVRIGQFIWILGNIHLNDNNRMPKKSEKNFDQLHKVHPLLDHLSEMLFKVFKPGQKQAIDESMIKFKGGLSLKQYMPKKPIKRGYKVWMRCDSSGFACEFQIYTGKTEGVERNLGERVTRNLSQKLLGKNHVLLFDNYFTSYDLLKHLETLNITACGTVNMFRRNLPKNLLEDKKMK